MSFIYKGAGLTLTRREPGYDAETGRRFEDLTYRGTESAIGGLTQAVENAGFSYRMTHEGPVWELQTRVPITDETTEDVDRWEISTATKEVSIFQHPDVVTSSATYDAGIIEGDKTWRGLAEDAVTDAFASSLDSVFSWVVDHLRNGISSYQIDTLVLRRFRRLSASYGYGAGRINLNAGQFLYTTAQLDVPNSVFFILPATPAGTVYPWAWLLRSQRVEILGSTVEQTFELEFAQWSTQLYTNSTGNLSW